MKCLRQLSILKSTKYLTFWNPLDRFLCLLGEFHVKLIEVNDLYCVAWSTIKLTYYYTYYTSCNSARLVCVFCRKLQQFINWNSSRIPTIGWLNLHTHHVFRQRLGIKFQPQGTSPFQLHPFFKSPWNKLLNSFSAKNRKISYSPSVKVVIA